VNRRIYPAIAMSLAFGALFSASSSTGAVPQSAVSVAPSTAAVDPQALQALMRMSTYLSTLPSFEVKTDTTLDLVTMRGQRLQLGGSAEYKVRRPSGFQIAVNTDFMSRRFYFDGKQFTVLAPKLNYYSTEPAPATNREMVDVLYSKYGIALPLADLFRWSDPESARAEKLTSAFLVGPVTLDGVLTDHYAFREADQDWEIWIDRGNKPLPRKIAIVSKRDSARPAYVAHLTWNVAPNLRPDDFTFKPTTASKQIHIAEIDKNQG
jgi:hypothetical protein